MSGHGGGKDVVVHSLSRVQFFVTLWTAAHQAPLSSIVSWSFLKLMSIESVMLSNHLILCYPLLLSPSIFPNIRFFSHESALYSHTTTTLLTPDVWGIFLHQMILCDTSWVSCGLTQCWHYFPRQLRLRFSPRGLLLPRCPSLDASCKSQVVICNSDQLAVNHGFHDPFLGFSNLPEWLKNSG